MGFYSVFLLISVHGLVWIPSDEEAIPVSVRTFGGSTRVPTRAVPEIIHGGAPEVFLHQLKLESRHVTLTVLVRFKTQQKKTKKQKKQNKQTWTEQGKKRFSQSYMKVTMITWLSNHLSIYRITFI